MGHIELGNKVPHPQEKDLLYAQWFVKQREGSFLKIVGSTSKVQNALSVKITPSHDKMLVEKHMKRNEKVSLYYTAERYTREVP